MSQENVEVVRQAWEAFSRRDNEAALALYDPAVEVDLRHAAGFDSQVYRGVDGVGDYFRDWLGAFDDFTSEVEEWIDAGDEVIAMVHAHGRGKRSGVPVDMVQAHLWTLVDGKLRRLRIFATKAGALEAVGLSE